MSESPDKNVEAVRQKLRERSQVGLSKYGVTTERPDIDLVGWMQHAQEEAMDFSIYLEAMMQSHSDIATLEQENRQMRARMERLESDAARYHFLSDRLLAADFDWQGECVLVFQWPSMVPVGADCDKNIDAAIAAVQP